MPSDAINWLTHSLPASCMIRPAPCSKEGWSPLGMRSSSPPALSTPSCVPPHILNPLLHNAMWSILRPCPWGCSHRREPPSCQLPAEYSCQCLCNGEGCGGWGACTFSQQIPEQWLYILLFSLFTFSSFFLFYVLSFILSSFLSLSPTYPSSIFPGPHYINIDTLRWEEDIGKRKDK